MMAADYATFYLGGHYFGVLANHVLEVNHDLEITYVPKSPKTIRGIMNLRGQLLPAIDMYEKLGLPQPEEKQEKISIILQSDSMLLALLVDDVGPIIPLEDDTFEAPPNNFPVTSRELVLGVHKLPENLIIILDKKGIVNFNHHKNLPTTPRIN
jgi:purine-binding chemotaxis protein CheW